MSYTNTGVMTPLFGAFGPLDGRAPYVKEEVDLALEKLKVETDIFEKHLTTNTYLVGERVSLADLFAVPILKRGFDFLFGTEWRQQNPAITRWFKTVIAHPVFCGRFDTYKFRDAIAEPPKPKEKAKPKEQPKKKEKPAAAAADVEDEPPKEKKAAHPLAALGPSSKLVLDEWKRKYSNEETREVALPWFWEHYDAEEYSLWKVAYKYNDELTLTFMSNNLIGGFFNRLSASTKYLFGCEVVYGENNNNGIVGAFLVRGQDYFPAFEVAPDWESFEFTKLDASKPEDRAFIEDMWAWDKPYEGREIADGKVFK
jgi:elongation factor 1-gamma